MFKQSILTKNIFLYKKRTKGLEKIKKNDYNGSTYKRGMTNLKKEGRY